jgi:flagella basal body P-ring formation protein FlgA
LGMVSIVHDGRRRLQLVKTQDGAVKELRMAMARPSESCLDTHTKETIKPGQPINQAFIEKPDVFSGFEKKV